MGDRHKHFKDPKLTNGDIRETKFKSGLVFPGYALTSNIKDKASLKENKTS